MNLIAGESSEKVSAAFVAGAASAAAEMQRSAQSALSAIATETTRQSTIVAAAAQQTTSNVQTGDAAAAEELWTSNTRNLPSDRSLCIDSAKRRCCRPTAPMPWWKGWWRRHRGLAR